jgi:hypothetical protein
LKEKSLETWRRFPGNQTRNNFQVCESLIWDLSKV